MIPENIKAVDAHALAALLVALPPGTSVFCNRVRNLAILNPNEDCVGFIDFVVDPPTLEMFPEEKAS